MRHKIEQAAADSGADVVQPVSAFVEGIFERMEEGVKGWNDNLIVNTTFNRSSTAHRLDLL